MGSVRVGGRPALAHNGDFNRAYPALVFTNNVIPFDGGGGSKMA